MAFVGSSSSSDMRCSICWEDVSEACGRSVARLQCSHLFHLDCIGSAFNASGVMQCPNCRVIECGSWRCFGRENSPEGSEDHANGEEDHQFNDMQPREVHLCPFHGGNRRTGVLPSNGSQNMVEQPVVSARTPNVNHWPGQNMLTQISATHFVPNHPHNLGQPAMFTSMTNHITGANQSSVPTATLRDAHNNPDGIPNRESVGHRVILQHGNGPVYDNFHHMQPLSNNSPSPVVRSMVCARNGSNGLPGWLPAGHATALPEQTANFYPVPSLTISTQNHPQAAFIVHHHVQERGPFAPPEHFPDDIGPSWGMFN